ncbi:MAG TPA: ABC transporter substrate-binding protein [Acidimicrobiales bacterium]|nr:ABC transporter substrate-binding protein [Acidimicrobiales bacterium]
MPRPRSRRSITAALALSAVLVVSGCGSGGAGSADPTTSTAQSSAGENTPGSTPAASDAVDALTLEGPTEVADVPAVEVPETAATPKLPTTVTDAIGKKVRITSADRVIALDLYATLTDTMIGLGLADRLVGRAGSDTQAVLDDLPVVSRDGLELNTEAVLDLRPDLILTNLTIGTERVYAQLESAGITVVRFAEVPAIADIGDSIDAVGDVFGVTDEADRLAQHTEEQLGDARDAISSLRAATPRAPRAIVLYVRGRSGLFFIFGPEYGAAEVLDELGLDDVAGDSGITDLAPANAESLVSLDPEIILTMADGVESTGGIDGLLGRPGVAETTAGRNKRLVIAGDNQLLSYGPRTPSNLEALARAIYTDASGH